MKYLKSFFESKSPEISEDLIKEMEKEVLEIFLPFTDNGYTIDTRYSTSSISIDHNYLSVNIKCENHLLAHVLGNYQAFGNNPDLQEYDEISFGSEPHTYVEKITLSDFANLLEHLIPTVREFDHYLQVVQIYNMDSEKGNFKFLHIPKDTTDPFEFEIQERVDKFGGGGVPSQNRDIIDFLSGKDDRIRIISMFIVPLTQN